MSDEDWRVEVELADAGAAQRLHSAAAANDLAEHARTSVGDRAVVSLDGPVIFAYATTRRNAEAATTALRALLDREGLEAKALTLTRWHEAAERWEDPSIPVAADAHAVTAERAELEETERAEAAGETYPEWEVRVSLPSHRDAVAFAGHLAGEGLPCQRHWRYLLLGTWTEVEAEDLAARIRSDAPAGTTVATEGTYRSVSEHRPMTGTDLLDAEFAPFATV
jgi:hypothetical protein